MSHSLRSLPSLPTLRRRLPLFTWIALPALAVLAANARDAEACGGCFHPPPGPQEVESVVTDHRMVFSISPSQTVLWDQIRYSGDPTEFAWVLPVHPGAHVELSHDAWIAALDASTQSVVTGPAPKVCYNGGSFGSYGDSHGGGGCGLSSSDTASSFAGPAAPTQDADGGFAGNGNVQVVSQDTVGPYETVTVRASQGDALETWLLANGFDVPVVMKPTLGAYAQEGFDFIALKLRPGLGVRAMQPVRIVSPGADASLPLRMVAAGIGSHVGLTLYVVSEGRYHTENFPDAVIDFKKLAWDPIESHSNFASLTEAAMSAGDGRGWITEYAGQPDVTNAGLVGNGVNPSLSQAYVSLCQPTYGTPAICDAGGPPPPIDAGGSSDAASDAAATDASDAAPHACPPPQKPSLCDDLTIALDGLHPRDVWVTRLRAHLPANALAIGDLRLAPTTLQTPVTNLHHTDAYVDPTYDPCPKSSQSSPAPTPSHSESGCACTATGADHTHARDRERTSERVGTWLVFACAALGTGALLRQRRRASRGAR